MALSSVLSANATYKQDRCQEIGELSDANVRRSASFDDFARQQFYKNRKVIIRNVPRVTYDVRMNGSIHFLNLIYLLAVCQLVFTRIWNGWMDVCRSWHWHGDRPLVKCRLRTCGPDLRTGKWLGLVLGFMLRVRVRAKQSKASLY